MASPLAHGAGWTSPSGVRKNFSFSPSEKYTRPEMPRGTWIVVLPPLPGPAMATSGAADGGFDPAGHAVNVPPALT